MASLSQKSLLILGVALGLLALSAEGNPLRQPEELIGGLGLDSGLNSYLYDDIDSNDLDKRDARRAPGYGNYQTTYPPFPGDDDDYDRYVTEREPQTAPPYIPPPTETTIVKYNDEYANNENEEDDPLHKKVVPWFKRQWGRTKNFFKKHYEAASNSIG